MSVIAITKNNFKTEVEESDRTVLIDFWAPWCGPCRMFGPIVEEASKEATDVKFGKVNIDEEPELAEKFKIQSIPTIVIIKNGKVDNFKTGMTSKEALLNMVKM